MTLKYEIFEYYKMGFRKVFNFTEPSCRKELNCFILIYLLLLIAASIINAIFVCILSTVYSNKIDLIELYNNIVFVLFNTIHIIPLASIIKRRLIDINKSKAKPLFFGIVCIYLIYISLPIMADTDTDAAYALIKLLSFIPYIVISLACGIIMFFTILYLMVCKGELNIAPLDKIHENN